MVVHAVQVDENLTIYPLVKEDQNQGWTLELFELKKIIKPHSHEIQQMVIVVEGELQILCDSEESLRVGEIAQIDPGVVHSLIPKGTVRFFSLDLFDEQLLPPLDLGVPIKQEDYLVYELLNGTATEKKWSVALLEIQDSPRHFHKIEKEIFVVVSGALDIEIDGIHHIVQTGEAVTVVPSQVHQLKSAHQHPVRVLCFNFPAFSPADMYTAPT